MKLQNLKLSNYRNYENLEISFSDTLNLIYGNNGSGKSNLIEAIYLLALTKSFRTNNDRNLIQKDKKLSTVEGIVNQNDDKVSYKIELDNSGKKVYINKDKINKISDYITKINIILFNPLDTKIITDSPASRRKMLNIEISQVNKEYLLLLANYNKVLKHRNAYLKQLFINGNASSEYIDILTKKLVDIGYQIYEIRKEYIELINEHITDIYQNIFEYGNLSVKYKSDYLNKDNKKVMEEYRKNYKKEMSFGKTLTGVHHDDIEFVLDGNNIKDYGSVGQQKNSIISFKLSELIIAKKLKGEYPILILDDLFSELDNIKINNIISMLNEEVQTFITSTGIENINSKLLDKCTIYKVENNTVEGENNGK